LVRILVIATLWLVGVVAAIYLSGLLAPVLIPALIALVVAARKRPEWVTRLMSSRAFRRAPRFMTATPMRFALILAILFVPISAISAQSIYGGGDSNPPPRRAQPAQQAVSAPTATAVPTAPTSRPAATATSSSNTTAVAPLVAAQPAPTDVPPTEIPATEPPPTEVPATETPEPTGPPGERFDVVSVVDGDTIKVNYNGVTESVRLILVDTPETKDPNSPVMCYGAEATAFTEDMIRRAGGVVYLEKDVSERDRYDRLLRYVWLVQDDGGTRILNFELIAGGYAQVATFPPDVRYVDMFLNAQREARDTGRGLWGSCGDFGVPVTPPTPTPEPVQVAPEPPPATGGGSAPPQGSSCPDGHPIKGNHSSSGEWIYHRPGQQAYNKTIPEECFATGADAEAAGYRAAKR